VSTLSDSIDRADFLLQKLLQKHEAVKGENEFLKQKLSKAEADLKLSNEELEQVQEKMRVISLAKSLDTDESENKKDLKLKINEMMREIDKCIALLNN